ncbi:MAG: diguanylate cyclase domain-containing protein [Ruegeria sp.]
MSEGDQLGEVLETLCPMFILLGPDGCIQRVGSTLQKLRTDQSFVGRGMLDIFELVRPKTNPAFPKLITTAGCKLHLKFRDKPRTMLKGLVAPLPGGKGAVINLSFGISIVDAVRDYALTSADFSGTDLAVELLYLVEAKSAAMAASRSLNLRLQGAMLAAEKQAYTDTLTGLKNRRAMDSILENLVSTKSPFALMHLDLDFFKSVNDELGHAAGDHVLCEAARIMIEEVRSDDAVARIGGDEFVLVIRGISNREQLIRIANRLIGRLQAPMAFEGETCAISASIGTAMSSQFLAPKPNELLHAADLALYEAKRSGRSCHRFYSESVAGRQ